MNKTDPRVSTMQQTPKPRPAGSLLPMAACTHALQRLLVEQTVLSCHRNAEPPFRPIVHNIKHTPILFWQVHHIFFTSELMD